MIPLRATAAASVLLVLIGSVAACGTQTDARVTTSAPATEAAPASQATASQAPASQAPASAAPAPSPTFTTPFVTVDCATGAAVGVAKAPTKGTTVDGVTAELLPSGVPAITVPTGPAQASTLGSADLVVGTGAEAKAGDLLTVDYCGVGLGSKTLFDSSYARGGAATFPLSGVIEGWQKGVPGMKVGGMRLLVIPGALAYGDNPPPGIGANETLVFTVSLSKIGN